MSFCPSITSSSFSLGKNYLLFPPMCICICVYLCVHSTHQKKSPCCLAKPFSTIHWPHAVIISAGTKKKTASAKNKQDSYHAKPRNQLLKGRPCRLAQMHHHQHVQKEHGQVLSFSQLDPVSSFAMPSFWTSMQGQVTLCLGLQHIRHYPRRDDQEQQKEPPEERPGRSPVLLHTAIREQVSVGPMKV